MTVERRMEVRQAVNREFTSVDQFIDEYVTNISRSGVFIRSTDPLPIDTRVNLRFSVILDDIEIIEGIGEVVRVIIGSETEPSGMGVVFVEMTQVSKQLIERILIRRG